MSNLYQSLSHSKWDCKYHIVWIPKYRKKTLFRELRQELGPVLRELATRKESEILEGRLLVDHALCVNMDWTALLWKLV